MTDDSSYCRKRNVHDVTHCWHKKKNQHGILGPEREPIYVICCFCGLEGIGHPEVVKDPNHGEFNPAVYIKYTYEVCNEG